MPQLHRIAVIGRTGRGDYGHDLDLAWLVIPGCQIVAVADDDKAGLAAAAKRLGVSEAFTDWREMLDRVRPSIVAVATRWVDEHAEICMAAAERGIHVYIEKPLCRTLAEADAIVAACERTHSKLALAVPTRYSPKLQTVGRLLAEGALGQVLEFRGRGKEDRRGGSEDLWVLGTHVLDMIRGIGGPAEWCFARVTQEGRPLERSDVVAGNEGLGPLAGDSVQAMYGLAGGPTAYFGSIKNAGGSPSRYGLRIYTSRGIVEILEGVMPSVKFLPDPSWCPGRSGKTWQDVSTAGVGKPEPLVGAEYTARHTLPILDLLASIEDSSRQPLANVYEARAVVEMIAAVFESARLGGPVKLPLENRENPLAKLA